ncbi:MAG: DUF4339 domain-containing protein [Proteobacteria bacterium]|nr:DUF4339 domain-containing protein [Pseudomonadota bacterium]
MKIVCENCSAKYSIADEKVKGKVFKIRCKKCGESIVVRGDAPRQTSQPAAAPAAEPEPQPVMFPPPMPSKLESNEETEVETKVFDYSGYQDTGNDEAVWHIVVNGGEQGPYTETQIREYLDAGSLDFETLVWKEGFEDWVAIRNVPELATGGIYTSQPAGAPVETAQAAPQDAGAGGGLFDAQPAEGGLFDQPSSGGIFGTGSEPAAAEPATSPFDTGAGLFGGNDSGGDAVLSSAAPTGPSTGGLFSVDTALEGSSNETGGIFSDAGGAAGPDLFGGGIAEGGGVDELFSSAEGPAPSPRIGADAMMTGQRNENSVLFSLSNLQALAATPQAELGPSVSSSALAVDTSDAAPEEGSGLIDIRSLASSLTAEKENTGMEDLISMGGGGFAPSLGAPVLAPQQEGMSLWMKLGIAGGSVAVLAVIVVLLVVAMAGGENETANLQIAKLQEQLEKIQTVGPGTAKPDTLQAAAQIAEANAAEEAEQKAEPNKAEAADKQTQPSEEKASSSSSKSSKSKNRGSSSKSKSSSSKSTSSSSKSSSSSGGSDSLFKSTSSKSGSKSDSSDKASATPTPAKKKGGSDELDDLLGGSLAKPKKDAKGAAKAKDKPSGGGDLKKNLDRADVQKGMNGVAGRVRQCAQGQRGTVTLKVIIGRTGRVISANATGPYAGTPVGSCSARAVRAAKFPKTQNNLTVRYPFKL